MEHGKPQKQALAIAYSMKKHAKRYASGGQITDNYQSSDPCPHNMPSMDTCEECSGFVSHPGDARKSNSASMTEDDRDLNQHGADETGPVDGYAEGGQITDNYEPRQPGTDYHLVDRIMQQRRYSKGGRVANEDHGHNDDELAGFSPNEFDDLSLRDDLESGSNGANNGDYLDNEREDKDRRDVVSRIMASRRKRGRMPSPK